MIKEWLAANPIGIEDGLRHDKWCAMMWPRLRLLHELLADSGSIWITLDDTEVHRCKLICEEIFGPESLVANVIWQKKYTRANDATYFSDNHDHVLCFAKNKKQASSLVEKTGAKFELGGLARNQKQVDAYQNPNGHKKGPWKPTPLHAKSGTNTKEHTFPN
jgi:adenine-specific DNA-methyltransferase